MYSPRKSVSLVVLFLAASLAVNLGAASAAAAGREESHHFAVRDIDGGVRRIPDAHAPATVLIFIAHDCPISCVLLPEVERVRKTYPRVPFYVVYAEPNFTPAQARKHGSQYHIGSVCLTDQWTNLVHWTGAATTPEAVILEPDGKIFYKGRVDNLYAGLGVYRPSATTHDLRDALNDITHGLPPPRASAPAVGCSIEMMAKGEH